MPTTVPPAVASAGSVPAGKPLERAQAVWRTAVDLADGPAGGGFGVVLPLLRAADFDPSTLRHALTLGRTLLRRRPHDARLRSGRQLLQRATDWLGVRSPDGEVGSARSDRRRLRPGAPEASRVHRAHPQPSRGMTT